MSSSITRRLDRIERRIAPTGGIDPALLADVAQTLERLRRQDEAILARSPDVANTWRALDARYSAYIRAQYGDTSRYNGADWYAISERDPILREYSHALLDCLTEAQERTRQAQRE